MVNQEKIKHSLRDIFLLAIVWRAGLQFLTIFSDEIAGYEPSFPYAKSLLAVYGWPRFIYSWANFDGVHYLTIVNSGYIGTGLIQAFFPGYPLVVWFVGLLPYVDSILASLVVSHVFLVTAIYFFWKLMRLDYSLKQSWWMIVALLLFPTSFYLVSTYSEGLFLTLIFASFFMARTKRWLPAIAIAALATATRVVGIFLVPALVLEYLIANQPTLYRPKELLKPSLWIQKIFTQIQKLKFSDYLILCSISLGSLGLISYMLYLHKYFGDALYFFHVQEEFTGARQETIILYPQVLWRATKILLTVSIKNSRYWSFLQEWLFGFVGLILLGYSWFKVRWSYWLFAILAFILPTVTGTFSSMPRYALVSFPLIMMLGELLNSSKKYRWFIILVLIFVLSLNTILFIQGHWIA